MNTNTITVDTIVTINHDSAEFFPTFHNYILRVVDARLTRAGYVFRVAKQEYVEGYDGETHVRDGESLDGVSADDLAVYKP